MPIKGIFFDFGFVIGYPLRDVDRSYFYLDWDGIGSILHDPELTPFLKPGIRLSDLASFFREQIYDPFVRHEQTDHIDPQSNKLLLAKLSMIFDHPIDQTFVDKVLVHINTMKYLAIAPEVAKIIHDLKRRGYWLSIVSNMMLPGKLLLTKLDEANILNCFDHILISSDAGYVKPHPQIFRCALEQSNLPAEEVLFVGDTYQQDIVGAKRVGLKTVWLNCRHEPRSLAENDPPDYEIESISQLIQLPIFNS
jgi:HAD superfamily hydrolase (TIGR01549 family)